MKVYRTKLILSLKPVEHYHDSVFTNKVSVQSVSAGEYAERLAKQKAVNIDMVHNPIDSITRGNERKR